MKTSRKMKSVWTGVLVAVVGMLAGTSARGDILVYEPFDYAVGNKIAGTSGSTEIGLTNTWQTQSNYLREGFVFPASSGWVNSPTWDGVVNNLPTAPGTVKYAGSEPGDGEARLYRQLSRSVADLAGADGILWLSAVQHYENRANGSGLWIGLGSGWVNDRGLSIYPGPNGGKDFMGSSQPKTWNPTLFASIETNNVSAAYQIFPKASLPPTTEDCIVVLKYTFGDGTPSTVDTVEGAVFSENATLSEAAFNSHPNKVSASFDSSLIDESTFNVLSFYNSNLLNAWDEIRIGDTFDDVVGLAVGPVDAGISSVLSSLSAVPADGTTPSVITVTLRDQFWIPVTNHTVSLSGTASATITPSSATTDASGQATFEVTSTTVGTEIFTATDTTASVVITQTASVEFQAVDNNAPPTPTFVTPLGPVTYYSIHVVASPVTDPEGKDVEYRFNNVTLATDSGWLSSPSNTFVGLAPDTLYSFTVEARDNALPPNVSTPSSAEAATTLSRPTSTWNIPDSTANVLVWLDAADESALTTNGAGQVTEWADKSGNDNHQLQANTSYQPVSGTRTINGLNALDFGIGDSMQEAVNAFGSLISNTMVFAVIETDTPDGDANKVLQLTDGADFWNLYSMGYDDAGDFRFSLSGNTLDGNGQWMHLRNVTSVVPDMAPMQGRAVVVGLYDCPALNSIQMWFDAKLGAQWVHYGSSTPVGPSITSNGIELAYDGTFDGAFAEVVIIDGIVTTEERQQIEGYLAWKWGSELSLPADHPYYDAPPPGPPPSGTLMFIK